MFLFDKYFQKNAVSLLYIAEKYNVDMATHMEDILQRRLGPRNALLFLSISYKFNLKNLKATSATYTQKHFMTPVIDDQMKVSSIRISSSTQSSAHSLKGLLPRYVQILSLDIYLQMVLTCVISRYRQLFISKYTIS